MRRLYSLIATEEGLNANPDDPVEFKQQVTQVCQLHRQALELYQQGIHLVSTDEMTGIQALERAERTRPAETRTGRASGI